MPVWHVSNSLQRKGVWIEDAARLERLAIHELLDVGGDVEWWVDNLRLNPNQAFVGHLRVTTTPAEQLLIPPGLTTIDAGETGPPRRRTR